MLNRLTWDHSRLLEHMLLFVAALKINCCANGQAGNNNAAAIYKRIFSALSVFSFATLYESPPEKTGAENESAKTIAAHTLMKCCCIFASTLASHV